MITLYSYPELFGVADNNPYGLKVFAFLKLAKVPFEQKHIFDAKSAPRAQLPYIVDDGVVVGDSDAILAYVTQKYALTIDSGLSAAQRTTCHFLKRTLDDLYWCMSYSRWRDDRYWPAFRDEMVSTHSILDNAGMESARAYNFERYRYQGIGRYEPDQVYARGIADLQALSDIMPDRGYLFGDQPTSADAAAYGFVANIYYFHIDTPLKRFVQSQASLVRHVEAIHALIGS